MERVKVTLLMLIIIWLGLGTFFLSADTNFSDSLKQINSKDDSANFMSKLTHTNLEYGLRQSFRDHCKLELYKISHKVPFNGAFKHFLIK